MTDRPLSGSLPEMLDASVPDTAARDLYLTILRAGGRLLASDVRDADRDTVSQLVALGLLVLNIADAAYSAVNPRAVSERISSDLRTTGTRLLLRAEQLPDLLGDLTQAYEAAPRNIDRSGAVQHVHGMSEIRHLVSRLAQDYRQEVLACQPGGARPPEHLGDSLNQARDYLGHGGAMRTIYEPAARLHGPTAEYCARAAALGGGIRLLDQPFKRLLIFDRTVAVIPASADNTSATFIEDPAMVEFLVGFFEQQWQQAEGVDWAAVVNGTAESQLPAQIGRLLSQGLTQKSIANRLGLSERTVAGHISRLREQYDADTLFQLGWQMRGGRGD
ncbi:LuxR C-terminal-related transcriptional regulator [Kitasatospora sp. NPDC057223]|uniref:LuxR C-terminal-related transcriptional regulator n=1 Tax=Kitasatospora sp. NPDC057223 TaxID=3346055 RepID=UPI0036354E17